MLQQIQHLQHLPTLWPRRVVRPHGWLPYIQNLNVDLWADDLDASIADAGAITTWTDRKSRIVFTGSGTAKPLLKKNWIGGKSYVQFDGVDDLLASTDFLDSSYDKACTIIVVRDINGVEPADSNNNIFLSNPVGSFFWMSKRNRSNSTCIAGNLGLTAVSRSSNGCDIEVVKYDGTTLTQRFNGIATATSSSGNLGLSGALNLGGFPAFHFCPVYIRRVLVFKECLSDANLRAIEQTLYTDSGMRSRKTDYFLGDSQTYGLTATLGNDYPAYSIKSLRAALGSEYNYVMNGVPSRTLADMAANYATEIRPQFMGARNRLVIRAGTNDLFFGATAAATHASLLTLCALAKADGAQVAVCEIMKRTDAGTPGGFEAARQAYNALINADSGLFSGVITLGNATIYPEFSDTTNATYFSDLVHNTDLGNSICATGNGNDTGIAGALQSFG